jgi:hypothetical protein
LLEADDVVDRDPGELGQFFAAQAGGAAGAAGWQPDVGRGQPVAPGADGRAQTRLVRRHSGTQTVTEGTDAIVTLATEPATAGTGRYIDRFGPVPW